MHEVIETYMLIRLLQYDTYFKSPQCTPPKETQIDLNYKKMNEQSKQSYLGKHHKCIPLESLEQFWPLMSCDGQH